MKKIAFVVILLGVLIIPISSLAFGGTIPMHGYFFGNENVSQEDYQEHYDYMQEYHDLYREDKEAWIADQLEQGLISEETAEVMRTELRYSEERSGSFGSMMGGNYGGPCH